MFQISALDHQMHSHYTAWIRVGHKACVSEQCLDGFGELGLSEETGDSQFFYRCSCKMWTFLLLGTKLQTVNYDNPIRKSCGLINWINIRFVPCCATSMQVKSGTFIQFWTLGGNKIKQLETKVPLPPKWRNYFSLHRSTGAVATPSTCHHQKEFK